jgi:hypothetical protein
MPRRLDILPPSKRHRIGDRPHRDGGVFTRGRKTGSPRPLPRDYRRAGRKNCCLVARRVTERINALATAPPVMAEKVGCCVAARDCQKRDFDLRQAGITESAVTRCIVRGNRHLAARRQPRLQDCPKWCYRNDAAS